MSRPRRTKRNDSKTRRKRTREWRRRMAVGLALGLLAALGLLRIFEEEETRLPTVVTSPQPADLSAFARVSPSAARSTEPVPARATPADTRKTARKLLDRRAPSSRSQRARSLRRQLGELRNQLVALGRNPSEASAAGLGEKQRALADAYWGESGDRPLLPAGSLVDKRMEALMEDFASIDSDPSPSSDDLQRIIGEIDAALETPDGGAVLQMRYVPITAGVTQ